MKKLIYYSVAATVVGGLGQWAGWSLMTIFMASLLVPPALLVAWIVFRSRDIDRKTREHHWKTSRR